MLNLEKRLIQLSDFLKITSFFWEKELLNQDITQLPAEFYEFAKSFQKSDLQTKAKLANRSPHPEIAPLLEFESHQEEFTDFKGLFIKQKKRHELSRILAYFHDQPPKSLTDLCGGVGHLPLSIRQINPGLKSRTLDYDPKLIKKGKLLSQAYEHIEFQEFDLRDQKISTYDSEFIMGLHTCGDLAEHALNYFINSNSNQFIGWGCCYHKTPAHHVLSQIGQIHLPHFDKFALTLAAKCHKLHTPESIRRRYQVKKYRYALALFLGNDKNFQTGSFHHRAYLGSFIDYIQYSQKHLGIEINIKKAQVFYQENIDHIERLISLGFYRDHWGRVIETCIILDRALYLKEKGYQVNIIEIFDRAISPRNLTLTAKKV